MAIINVVGRKPRVTTSDGHGMVKGNETPGKRSPELPGGLVSETGKVMFENEFNRRVETLLHIELKRCGFDVLALAPGDVDVPLEERVRREKAYNGDFHLDIHANAFDAKFQAEGVKDPSGIETFYYNSATSKACAGVIHKHVMGGSKMVNRGTKDGSHLFMLKNTKAPANLVELGFMDNIEDIKKLLSESYRQECAIELAKGICEIFGKPYIPKPAPAPKPVVKPASKPAGVSYRVVAGSFTEREGAEKQMKDLKAKGFDSFIAIYEK